MYTGPFQVLKKTEQEDTGESPAPFKVKLHLDPHKAGKAGPGTDIAPSRRSGSLGRRNHRATPLSANITETRGHR